MPIIHYTISQNQQDKYEYLQLSGEQYGSHEIWMIGLRTYGECYEIRSWV